MLQLYPEDHDDNIRCQNNLAFVQLIEHSPDLLEDDTESQDITTSADG